MTTKLSGNSQALDYLSALLDSDDYKRQAQAVFLLACSSPTDLDTFDNPAWRVFNMDVLHRLNHAMMESRSRASKRDLNVQSKALQSVNMGLEAHELRFFDGYRLRRLIHNRFGLPKAWQYATEQSINDILSLLGNPALSFVEWKFLASLSPCARLLMMDHEDQRNELWRIIGESPTGYLRSLSLAILTVVVATEQQPSILNEHIELLFKNADGIGIDAVAWVLPFILQNDDDKLTISVQPFLRDKSLGVHYRTMIALARIGTPAAINILVQVLHTGEQEARGQAASALGHSRKPELVLEELFTCAALEKNPETRKAIAEAIIEVNLPERFSDQLTLDDITTILNIRAICQSKGFDEGIDAVDSNLGRLRSLSPDDFDEAWTLIVDYPQSPRLLSECENMRISPLS